MDKSDKIGTHKMNERERLNKICRLLNERYADRGKEAAGRLQNWLSGDVAFSEPDVLIKHLDEDRVALLYDVFSQVLPFGTGGRRGRVGYGSNRLNPATVALTVQGHCNYLHATFPGRSLSVVVANDVRIFHDIAETYGFLGKAHPLLGTTSRSLAKLACEIYAGNNIIAYCIDPPSDKAFLTTPELSFLINKLKAAGGINVSASHNPPDDNGVKVYDEFGSQPVPPNDQRLADAMDEVKSIRRISFADALRGRQILSIPRKLHESYIQTYVDLYGKIFLPQQDLPIVYTPLCGCGLESIGDLLKELQFPVLVPPNQGPDGTFSVIPFRAPNPEVAQATVPAATFAAARNSGIVLSSDPDADRVGLEIRLRDGAWYHFDGNKIASLLAYFLMLDPNGPKRRGLVIETLVTTRMLGGIVARAGDSWLIDDLLVGFKYIANVLKTLEEEGQYQHVKSSPDSLVLAAEESHGVMMVPIIRDKDAAPACMYLSALYQMLCRGERTLLDYYLQVLEQIGGYADVSRSIVLSGPEGKSKIDRIMASLRTDGLGSIGSFSVHEAVDYWNEELFGPFKSETDKWSRNLIQFHLDDSIVTVRPSGTEPKLKFYCQLKPYDDQPTASGLKLLQEITHQAESLARLAYGELLRRIDLDLRQPGLLLPDIIEIDRKIKFERETLPQLRRSLLNGAFDNLDSLFSWLRSEIQPMTPGADPIPAVKSSIASLCEKWADEMKSVPVFSSVRTWAEDR